MVRPAPCPRDDRGRTRTRMRRSHYNFDIAPVGNYKRDIKNAHWHLSNIESRGGGGGGGGGEEKSLKKRSIAPADAGRKS